MKYAVVLLSVGVFLSGCSGGTSDLVNEPASSHEITYKEAFTSLAFQNDKMSFDLYYESELGTLEMSPSLIEVYEKGSPAAKDLAGADILVMVNSGQMSDTYDEVLDYYTSYSGTRSYVYDFPESDGDLVLKRHVDVIEYAKSPMVVYMMYWTEYGKDYYVQVTQNTEGDKRLLQAESIFKTIELKGITNESATAVVSGSVDVTSPFPNGWTLFESKEGGWALGAPSDFALTGGGDMENLANYDINDVQAGLNGLNIQIQTDHFEGTFEEKMVSMGATPFSLGTVTYSYYESDGPGGAFQQYFVEGENKTYYTLFVFEPGYSKNVDLVKSLVGTFVVR